MKRACADCPNRYENLSPSTIKPGDALVYFSPDDSVSYVTLDTASDFPIQTGMINDQSGEQFPDLAGALEACEGPIIVHEKVPKPGFLNLILNRDQNMAVGGICPALDKVLDIHSSQSVREYFGKDLE